MKLAVLLFACSSMLNSFGQNNTDTASKKLRVYPLPMVFFSPETDLGAGAVSLFSFRFKGETPESKISQFQFGAVYTKGIKFCCTCNSKCISETKIYLVLENLAIIAMVIAFLELAQRLKPQMRNSTMLVFQSVYMS